MTNIIARRRGLGTAVFLFLATVTPTPVAAQDAATILGRIDSAATAFRDMSATERMTLLDDGGSTRTRDTQIYQKGREMRLVRFLTPADVRGVGFLRISADRLYLYLPALHRVRRIASSIRNQGFMGTDFTYEDMSQATYSGDYQPTTMSTDSAGYVLDLKPRPGADVSYGRLRLRAGRKDYVIREIEYFDRDGRPVKRLTVSDVAVIHGYAIGHRMEMRDLQNGHRTVLDLQDVSFDQGLADDFFSARNLKRPLP